MLTDLISVRNLCLTVPHRELRPKSVFCLKSSPSTPLFSLMCPSSSRTQGNGSTPDLQQRNNTQQGINHVRVDKTEAVFLHVVYMETWNQ